MQWAAAIAVAGHVRRAAWASAADGFGTPEPLELDPRRGWEEVLDPGCESLGSGGFAHAAGCATTCSRGAEKVAVKTAKDAGKLSCLDTQLEYVRMATVAATTPYVPQVYAFKPASCEPDDFGGEPGEIGIMMELAHGTLADVLGAETYKRASGRDRHRLVARAGLAVASALDAVHQAGLVHRDVKAANVLVQVEVERLGHRGLGAHGPIRVEALATACLAGDCHFLLADFGAACRAQEAYALALPPEFALLPPPPGGEERPLRALRCADGDVAGSYKNLTPEDAAAEVGDAVANGWSKDYWSLGMLLLEAATGRVPEHIEASGWAGGHVDYAGLLTRLRELPDHWARHALSGRLQVAVDALLRTNEARRVWSWPESKAQLAAAAALPPPPRRRFPCIRDACPSASLASLPALRTGVLAGSPSRLLVAGRPAPLLVPAGATRRAGCAKGRVLWPEPEAEVTCTRGAWEEYPGAACRLVRRASYVVARLEGLPAALAERVDFVRFKWSSDAGAAARKVRIPVTAQPHEAVSSLGLWTQDDLRAVAADAPLRLTLCDRQTKAWFRRSDCDPLMQATMEVPLVGPWSLFHKDGTTLRVPLYLPSGEAVEATVRLYGHVEYAVD